MGLLDDAIREHLELKRRHGAPDEEIQRAEQEALGPARRDTSLDTVGVGVPPVEEVAGEEIEEPAPSAFDQPSPAAEELPPPPPPPVDDPVYADEYEVEPAPADYDEPTQIQPAREASVELESLEDLEEEELEEAPPPGTAKPHGDPAIGDYSEPVVNTDDIEEDPEAREDVLEETPEFLQDTPEHDKLWFEQKPPRDFDFD
jgi:hypothetical protein